MRPGILAFALILGCSGKEAATPPNPPADDTGIGTDVSSDVTDVGVPLDATPGRVVVTTDRGPVSGTADGSGGVFLGIPYAAPPTGARRFRPPEKHEPWTTAMDTTKLGKACPQGPDVVSKAPVPYDEDCLTLNVWTKQLAPAAPAPVMVWIHGGGFIGGSSNLALYDGARLSREGVVVVTINYRLGALGFLGHPALSAEATPLTSGNNGFLDQVRALEWVRDNAKVFGGDPGKVTIFGESAGGVSVCLHLVAPKSKGLFHRAISESGSCSLVTLPLHDLGTPTVEDSAEEHGTAFARSLGCDSGDVPTCLRGKSVDLIVSKSGSLDLTSPGVGFGPNVDGVVFPGVPAKNLQLGLTNDVPYLVGSNADEGTAFTRAIIITNDAEYRAAVAKLAGPYATALLAIYPSSDFPTPKAAYDHMLGDIFFKCPARATVRAISPRVKQTYLYHFTHVTGLGKLLGLGAYHSAEIAFVFGNFDATFSKPTPEESALSDAIIGDWVRFAKSGDPGGTPPWPAYLALGDEHLALDTPIAKSSGLDQKHCDALAALAP